MPESKSVDDEIYEVLRGQLEMGRQCLATHDYARAHKLFKDVRMNPLVDRWPQLVADADVGLRESAPFINGEDEARTRLRGKLDTAKTFLTVLEDPDTAAEIYRGVADTALEHGWTDLRNLALAGLEEVSAQQRAGELENKRVQWQHLLDDAKRAMAAQRLDDAERAYRQVFDEARLYQEEDFRQQAQIGLDHVTHYWDESQRKETEAILQQIASLAQSAEIDSHRLEQATIQARDVRDRACQAGWKDVEAHSIDVLGILGQAQIDLRRRELESTLERANLALADHDLSQAAALCAQALAEAQRNGWPDLVASASRQQESTLILVGQEYLTNGNPTEARRTFRQLRDELRSSSSQVISGLTQACYAMGLACEEHGDTQGAVALYHEVLNVDSHHREARARLRGLEPRRRLSPLVLVGAVVVIVLIAGVALYNVLSGSKPPTVTPLVIDDGGSPIVPTLVSPTASPTTGEVVIVATSTPTAGPSATPISEPTSTLIIVVESPTVRENTVTPTVPPPTSAPTPTVVDRLWTFVGRVEDTNRRPIPGFQLVQLWGQNTPSEPKTNRLGSTVTNEDGIFVLTTPRAFPYYVIEISDLQAGGTRYGRYGVQPGMGGEIHLTQEVLFAADTPGMHDGTVFTVRLPIPTPTPTATPTRAPAPTPTPTRMVVPLLVAPDSGFVADNPVTFSWNWSGPALAENERFEVRVWKDGQSVHYGAAEPVRATSTTIDLAGAYGVQLGGPGPYNWTVALVQINPYVPIGPEALPRTVIYSPSTAVDPTVPPPPDNSIGHGYSGHQRHHADQYLAIRREDEYQP